MVFNERQSLRDSFIIYVIFMIEIPTIILMLVLWWTGKFGDHGILPVALFFLILGLTAWFVVSVNVELHLDERGVKYKSFPFVRRWRFVPIEKIEAPKLRKLDGMLEFGGIGPRVSRKTKAFIFSTDWVLEFKSDGKHYVFSTQKPKDIEFLLANWETETTE